MLWVKALHLFFVVGWFAGLFYLPRIFVNLAQTPAAGDERDRLLLMATKLYRFTNMLSIAVLAFGLSLWLGYGLGRGQGWLHAKLVLVAALFVFQHLCGRELAALRAGRNSHSHVWFRWFNEIPTILLFAVVLLVIVKPF
ncbi:MAG TPA: CopD family protein [Burkholderiaceae bacterium]|nr:CopD family protein [Burkholderiaceae bacterium]